MGMLNEEQRRSGPIANHERVSEQPPFDSTICTGSGDLKNATYFSDGPEGMTVVEEHMEIACTFQS